MKNRVISSPHEKGHVLRNDSTDSVDNLDMQPGSVLKATSVLVRALVRYRTHKLVQKVAVRAVDLDNIEASTERTSGSSDVSTDNTLNAFLGQLLRNSVSAVEGDCAWCNDILRPSTEAGWDNGTEVKPWGVGTCLAAGVSELDTDFLVLGVCKVNDGLPSVSLFVVPDTNVLWGDTTFRSYRSGFNERESGATADDTTHYVEQQVRICLVILCLWIELTVRNVPWLNESIFGRILAKRGELEIAC